MNVKQMTVFGAALLAASSSFAGDTEYPSYSDFVSTKSRAEVRAELNTAIADGSLDVRDVSYPMLAPSVGPGKSRDEVIAELKQFRAEYPQPSGDVNYPFVLQPSPARTQFAGMDTPTSGQ